ncbi:MAG: hypothetical protein NZ455_15415 [Bacteroidia bacterium]|nr:hypothetical protein [Bacteroidia bacterium]MDW8347874.1 hypothetical protein [Bacteroidia bacterium]
MKEYKTTSKFVENDILRYFYGEMSKEEKDAFEHALMTNNQLRKSYKELTLTLGILPDIEHTVPPPDTQIIQNILAFSQTTLEEKQRNDILKKNSPHQSIILKLRKYAPKPIIVGLAIVFSAIINFSGYSQYKQATNKKIRNEALEWESLDNKEIDKIYRDMNVIKEHRGGILPIDSTVYEVVNHEESNFIVLP